jgi:nucleoside-diphosphate-sugar epimerase
VRITVVGGSGFIGTHLAGALLAGGHSVTVFDLVPGAVPGAVHTQGDVRDAQAVSAAVRGAELVIDLAAEHRDDVRPATRYFEVNAGGARNLVAAASRWNVPRMLFTSSAAVYGHGQPGAEETCPLRPDTQYGESKAQAEAAYIAWQREDAGRRALTILRPSIVYGEGHHGNMRVLIEHLRRGRFALVDGGRNRKSVAYVGNLVAFIARLLDAEPGLRIFNYADPPAPTVRELVQAILALMPSAPQAVPSLPLAPALAGAWLAQGWASLRRREAAITPRRVRALRAETTLDVAAMQGTGFLPPFSLRDGLARTVREPAHG